MAEKDNGSKEKKISFKDTLNLPRTDFPIRPNAKENDPKMVARWQSEDLFTKTFYENKGKEKFILHDGPPYANGNIHLGHAYNKILKDIICKYHRMAGKHVPVTPGWDCHGLPIELNVTKENPDASKAEIKKKCRAYANKWVGVQKQEFKDLGVLMDWADPYLTMNFGYEASILRAFGKFVAQGYIERKNKTVPWCYSCQTVLATAEIEYHDRKDPSIYVAFPFDIATSERLFPGIEKEVSMLIWTTTPWTLPLNRAVVVKPDATYVVLHVNNKYVVIGKALAKKLCDQMGVDCDIVQEFKSSKLEGEKVHHPFVSDLQVPIIFDPFVAMEEGTACVHSAPGCGPEDYEIALKNNLEIFSPLSSDGKYTDAIVPKELVGMAINDGQIWVIKKLAELGRLLYKTTMRHSYPHCWRCRNGLMFRATKQWFCDLQQDNLKERAMQACDNIAFLPENSINRLKATIESRLEWCLSRQRIWGVPITALICNTCDCVYVTQQLVDKIADEVEKKGVEFWDTVSIDELIPSDVTCHACGERNFSKETDILDVWFDAGVSHYAVLLKRKALGYPADVYLEGKDQHRGWFQSSLLTSLVIEGRACTKRIITHGFTVDDKGRKMSKSLGNVVSPQEMIEKIGTDCLRLWASSIDCQSEAVVSDVLIKNIQEVFRKVRNTARFMLSNLYDFNIRTADAVPIDKMLPIDRYALGQLFKFQQEVILSYDNYDFTAVFHKLADYCSSELSSFYLDIIKDRLYVEKADGHLRRSAQTACWNILDALTRLIAPILSFAAERISDHYQKDKEKSIHLQGFADLSYLWSSLCKIYPKEGQDLPPHLLNFCKTHEEVTLMKHVIQEEEVWALLKEIRSTILKAIEGLREKQIIRHSLEAAVTVYFDMDKKSLSKLKTFYMILDAAGQNVINFFKEFLIVSQFAIAIDSEGLQETDIDGVFIKLQKAHGDKCPRCWQWDASDHEYKLCSRCQGILK